MGAFWVHLKDDAMRTDSVGVSRRREETRESPGDVSSLEDCTENGRPSEAVPEETVALEAPSENSGHA
ncbi:hypothetical protein NDU88_000949 [Pleurodeles waltl]|uniref:Uncharacterized protein n=1 Tax=Pleurodeles waltl TaxID=8319 RepID=A0AAV7M1P0_PLEWA|nr:hypothetical protein NDU88_000949 [Pleurodeles waltl]